MVPNRGRDCADQTYYWNHSFAEIDIGKKEIGSGHYIDECGSQITVTKECPITKPAGLEGYKRYIHKITTGYSYVKGISHHEKDQTGLATVKGSYYKEASVYYLEYDFYNLIPLLVGFTKGNGKYNYYGKSDYLSDSNQWKMNATKDDQIPGKLNTISNKLNDIIVLKLDQSTPGIYNANGDSTKAPKTNNDTKVTVTGPYLIKSIYNRYEHELPKKSPFRVLHTVHGEDNMRFEDLKIYTKEYSSANVYYWEGDIDHAHPLLLELVPTTGSPTYYKTSVVDSRQMWQICDKMTNNELEMELDKLNCEKNNAHVVDISKTENGTYPCPACNKPKIISLKSTTEHSSKRSTHTVDGKGCIGKMVQTGRIQTGITYVKDVSTVTVFNYPESNGNPITILYSNKRFDVTSPKADSWKLATSGADEILNKGDTPESIGFVLNQYTQEIAIDVSKGDGQLYSEGNLNVIVQRTASVDNNFVFTHSVSGKSASTKSGEKSNIFKLSSVKYGTTILQGIESEFPLYSLSAFYYGSSSVYSRLLLVELEDHSKTVYKYFVRDEAHENIWVKDPRKETSRLEGDDLRKKLEHLYQLRFPIPVGKMVALVLIGIGITSFVAYESVIMVTNPDRSLIGMLVNFTSRSDQPLISRYSVRGSVHM